jgi:hypothetical protein
MCGKKSKAFGEGMSIRTLRDIYPAKQLRSPVAENFGPDAYGA